MSHAEIVTTRTLSTGQTDAVLALVAAATDFDDVEPLSEHTLLHLRHGSDDLCLNLLAMSHGELVGYAQLDETDQVQGAFTELVVAPTARNRGVGRLLLTAVRVAAADQPLRIWAHGRLPAATALASSLGFRRDRTLRRMVLALDSPLPDPQWADGVSVRPFQVGLDEDRWLTVNHRAFAALPDQGGWTIEDLLARESEDWFDPAGFFLAMRGEALAGFHWTKVHGGDHHHTAIGEVYVVGVDPAAQGLGLGKALTLLGLHHLQDRGLAEVMLYVDEVNATAIRLYESLGFLTRDLDVRFSANTWTSDRLQ